MSQKSKKHLCSSEKEGHHKVKLQAKTKQSGRLGLSQAKSGSRAPRPKPSYELYSSDSDEDMLQPLGSHQDGDGRHDRRQQTMHSSAMETKIHACESDQATVFNRRLTTSTPDPDRLANFSSSIQCTFEQNAHQGQPLSGVCTDLENEKEQLLSDRVREDIREQLDLFVRTSYLAPKASQVNRTSEARVRETELLQQHNLQKVAKQSTEPRVPILADLDKMSGIYISDKDQLLQKSETQTPVSALHSFGTGGLQLNTFTNNSTGIHQHNARETGYSVSKSACMAEDQKSSNNMKKVTESCMTNKVMPTLHLNTESATSAKVSTKKFGGRAIVRTFSPTKSKTAGSCETQSISSIAQFNRNNSSDLHSGQMKTSKNLPGQAFEKYGRHPDYHLPAAKCISARKELKSVLSQEFRPLNRDSLDPCSGTEKVGFHNHAERSDADLLREYLAELMHLCIRDGSNPKMEELIQSTTDLVNIMPVLHPNHLKEVRDVHGQKQQLEKRLENVNKQLKLREREQYMASDTKVQVEALNLMSLNICLKRKIAEVEGKLKEEQDHSVRQKREYEDKLATMQHDLLLRQKEEKQHVKTFHGDIVLSEGRNQALLDKIRLAEHDIRLRELQLEERDRDVYTLQETLGKVKQAASEVTEHITSYQGDMISKSSISNLVGFSFLQDFIRSNIAMAEQSPLEMSGNQRNLRHPLTVHHRVTSAKESLLLRSQPNLEKEKTIDMPSTSETIPVSNKPITKDAYIQGKQPAASGIEVKPQYNHVPDMTHSSFTAPDPVPCSREGHNTTEPPDTKEETLFKTSTSTGSIELTVAAVAAHTEALESSTGKGDHLSLHSWDADGKEKCKLVSRSRPYNSDPETTFHECFSQIKKWSTEVAETNQPAETEQRLPHAVSENVDHESNSLTENATDFASAVESPETLSEFTIPENDEETLKPSDALDSTQRSVTNCIQKNPEEKQMNILTSSPKASKTKCESPLKDSPPTEINTVDDKSPFVFGSSSFMTCSTSNYNQIDPSQRTLLDTSFSTIQDDDLSSVTALTSTTLSTALALNSEKFNMKLRDLDSKLMKTQQDLQRLKNC